MKPHEHKRATDCCCSLSALEPDDECPQHGAGFWPPRCEECGQLMSWPKPQPDSESAALKGEKS